MSYEKNILDNLQTTKKQMYMDCYQLYHLVLFYINSIFANVNGWTRALGISVAPCPKIKPKLSSVALAWLTLSEGRENLLISRWSALPP